MHVGRQQTHLTSEAGELNVDTITFSQLLCKHQVDLASVSLIKMDIEGR